MESKKIFCLKKFSDHKSLQQVENFFSSPLKFCKSLFQLEEMPPPYLPESMVNPGSKTRLLSHLKSLFLSKPTHMQKSAHGSIQPWRITDLILRITFGWHSCAWPYPYE